MMGLILSHGTTSTTSNVRFFYHNETVNKLYILLYIYTIIFCPVESYTYIPTDDMSQTIIDLMLGTTSIYLLETLESLAPQTEHQWEAIQLVRGEK